MLVDLTGVVGSWVVVDWTVVVDCKVVVGEVGSDRDQEMPVAFRKTAG